MAIALAVLSMVLAIAAAVIYFKNRRIGTDGTNQGSTRRGLIIVMVLAILLAFASQLSIFQPGA